MLQFPFGLSKIQEDAKWYHEINQAPTCEFLLLTFYCLSLSDTDMDNGWLTIEKFKTKTAILNTAV